MNNLEKKLNALEVKYENIENKLDIIINLINKNSKNCNKMGEHIDFVENVYEKVKNPLGFICNKVNSFISLSSSKEDYSIIDKETNLLEDK